jgi:predicted PurR-regulated permease PerM
VPWSLACTAVVLVLFGGSLLIPVGLGVVVPRVLQNLSDRKRQQEFYEDFRTKVGELGVTLDEEKGPFPKLATNSVFASALEEAINPRGQFLVPVLWQATSLGLSALMYWVLITFLLLFILIEGPMLGRRIGQLIGPGALIQAKATEALAEMSHQVRRYLVWRTIVNCGLALVLGAFYRLMGLSEPVAWALLVVVLGYIPYLGLIAAGIPPVLDAFVTSPHPSYALIVLFVYVLVCTLESYLIVPLVMGRSLELNATTVLLACLFWDLIWGTTGLFLAMPLMAAIRSACWHVPDLQPWAILMGTAAVDEAPPEAPVSAAEDGAYADGKPLRMPGAHESGYSGYKSVVEEE